jgi:polyphosphate kinase
MHQDLSVPVPELTPENFYNRELSNIHFQRRVLAMAADPQVPLLERLKFIAIVGNNLDEFFMVRVGAYLQKIAYGIEKARADGITPQRLIWEIRRAVIDLIEEQRHVLAGVLAELAAQDIRVLGLEDLDERAQAAVRAYYDETVFPVLTPLAADRARPFPFISNLSLNLAVLMDKLANEDGVFEFARIKIPTPDVLPRFVNLGWILRRYAGTDQYDNHFLAIEDIISAHLETLFPGMRIIDAYPFRVLRNADIDYEHEQDDDLLDIKSIIEQSLKERRFGPVVRVSVPTTISQAVLDRLVTGLEVERERDVYFIDGFLGSANLFELLKASSPGLKDPPYTPRIPEAVANEKHIFSAIHKQDIILHHPYDSFNPVEEFFRTAASDPDVLAIKATLYRVGKNSPVVNALLDARDNDKQVTVLVELKARFDEENNLEWTQALERKGVHVIYGVEELPVKTHAKTALVVRREATGVRRYVHLGTGNYNASTARLYTDMGLLTANEELADDASRLFNRLTGYAPSTSYQRLLVAPDFLLPKIIELIDGEIEAALAGKPARIIFKMNQLEEDTVIQKLYQASNAGVEVRCIVRGLCCLLPGLPGMSENITVTSIVGRYLEHSRIYYFQNAPYDEQLYIGSADIMRRNLYNRVEVVFPILDPRARARTMRLLETNLRDNTNSWFMNPDGTYTRILPAADEPRVSSQDAFMVDSWGLPG